MGGVLADYRCADCGVTVEHRVSSPPPSDLACRSCGGRAQRRFGFRVGRASDRPGGVDAAAAGGGHGHDHPEGLGTCGLVPTAARALTARLRGDERSLEREFRNQERMISEGTLDPAAGPRQVSPASSASATSSSAA